MVVFTLKVAKMNTKKILPLMMAVVPLSGVAAVAWAAQARPVVAPATAIEQPGDAAGPQGGQVVTPPSTIERPEDRGVNVRTHFYFWQPAGTVGRPDGTMEPKKNESNEGEDHEKQ
jgi:hypothetical protein